MSLACGTLTLTQWSVYRAKQSYESFAFLFLRFFVFGDLGGYGIPLM